MEKAAGYIRVSTPIQAKEGESLKTQREAIEKYAQEKNWKLIKVYSDEGISGAKQDRPALNGLLEDAEKKRFEYVIIHRLSRFGRNARDLLNNLDVLKNNGVKLVSIKDGIDYSNPYGEAMLTVLAAIAQLERDIIDEQMKENKDARRREQRTIVGSLPFGYSWDAKEKEIIVNEKEAEIYRKIVSMYVDEGKSLDDIAEQLERENIRTRRGRKWSSPAISGIFKNPIYYGHYVVNQIRYEGKNRTKEKKPISEHITWKMDEPLRLISKSRWDQIQNKTAFNKSKGKHIKISEDYFLRDVLECGECGGVIRPRHGDKRKDGSRIRYYACYWRWTSDRELKSHERKRCRLPFINAEQLEENIWNELLSYLSLQQWKSGSKKETPYDRLFDSKGYERKVNRLSEQMNDLEGEIKKKGRAKDRLFTLLEDERDHKDSFLKRFREIGDQILSLTSKREECIREIKELEEMKENDKLYREFLTDRRGFIKDLMKTLDSLDPKGKKLIVEGMLREKIRIWAGNGDGEWQADRPKLRFNKEVLIWLIEGKKPGGSNKDGSDDPP
jgi:DNA invertase Pin-like site-specific DNA recombinase